jgi:CelD/BcsL family acetyltransferase involved in cellulose biosynthesis
MGGASLTMLAARSRVAEQEIALNVVTTSAGFDALRPEWNALVGRLELPSPFHSWEWNRTWWRHFGRNRTLHLLTIRANGALLGIAPYMRRPLGFRQFRALSATALIPLGWEGHGRGCGLTEQWELLFPPEHRDFLLDVLADWLQGEKWSAAVLPSVTDSTKLPKWVDQHIGLRGNGIVFDYRRLPGTWDEFVQSLNKSMRDNVRYYPRKLKRLGLEYRFDIASSASEVRAALPIMFDLHRARADATMAMRHYDYFDYPYRREFMREVAPALAEVGQMRIGILRMHDQPVAAQMWMERNDVMFLYYSGFDPAFKDHSVALLATIGAFQDGIRRGIKQVEFLAGGGHPKARWDTERRQHHNLWLVRRPRMARLLLTLPIHYKRLA